MNTLDKSLVPTDALAMAVRGAKMLVDAGRRPGDVDYEVRWTAGGGVPGPRLVVPVLLSELSAQCIEGTFVVPV